MFFKQITSESTFDKIPSRPFLPRKAQVTARCPWFQWGISMTKSEKSNWRFFPKLSRGTDDIMMISWWYLIFNHDRSSTWGWKNHLKKTHLFQRKPPVSVAISMGIPRSQRGNVRWFHGTLAANHGYPEPRKSPSLVQCIWTFLKIGRPKSWFPNENRYIHPFSNVWVRNLLHSPKDAGNSNECSEIYGLCGEAPLPAAYSQHSMALP